VGENLVQKPGRDLRFRGEKLQPLAPAARLLVKSGAGRADGSVGIKGSLIRRLEHPIQRVR
jgi:hypothetical protein